MPEILSLDFDLLMPDPTQPRKSFVKEEIERLAASITARGVLQPLRVLWDDARQSWLIVTGESRWRAARLAGLTHLPCIPVEGEPDEADLLADRIVENACRNDLQPMEEARALAKLKALKGCNSQTLAKELGISPAAITRAEALLSLPDDVQSLVDDGRIPESAAYEISRLPDTESQRELSQTVAAGRMKRDQVAEAVRSRVGKRNVTPKASRVACSLGGGLSITMAAGEPLTWEGVLPAIDRLRREARKLCDGGQDVSALARVLKDS
jgi:ParB family chromosome partitioning protein